MKSKSITAIEIELSSKNRIIIMETEKKRKIDIIANHLGQSHKMKTKIFRVITWDEVATKTRNYYIKEL